MKLLEEIFDKEKAKAERIGIDELHIPVRSEVLRESGEAVDRFFESLSDRGCNVMVIREDDFDHFKGSMFRVGNLHKLKEEQK